MKSGMKTALIWGVLIGVVVLAVMNNMNKNEPELLHYPTEDLLAWIEDDEFTSYTNYDKGLILHGNDGRGYHVGAPYQHIIAKLNEKKVPFVPNAHQAGTDNPFISLLLWLAGAFLLLVVIFFFLRKMGGGQMNNIFELRKTKAREVQETDKASFADIGGNRDAVELLADIVDFLKEPKRWTAAGTRIPRGVLLVGPPGTGKTLLARAVAGETQSAFFYTTATEFVEMFVGVGSARVRDTFEKAATQQPAVIFIDEIDAIGRRRGSATGTMHEEREQTLNQLLVLMDGLEKYAQLVVMAATNRPDVLDPALLRSGRFDRMLKLKPPDPAAREEILAIHTRNKPLDEAVSLQRIAEQTEGFTGADLESLCNEAALLAVRRNRNTDGYNAAHLAITTADFENARVAMTSANRQFDRLDSLLVESVTQFAEPTGKAVARVTLTTGDVIEGEVLWMNMAHMKIRLADGSEVIIAKDRAERIVPLEGTESAPAGDFTPDRWAGRNVDVS